MKWTYDTSTISEWNPYHEVVFFKIKSEQIKEQIRIRRANKDSDLCVIYYTKIKKSNKIGFNGEYKWYIIDEYDKSMTYDDAKKIIYGDRLKKLNRILNV